MEENGRKNETRKQTNLSSCLGRNSSERSKHERAAKREGKIKYDHLFNGIQNPTKFYRNLCLKSVL